MDVRETQEKKKKNLMIEFKGSFIKELVYYLLLLFYSFAYKLIYSSIKLFPRPKLLKTLGPRSKLEGPILWTSLQKPSPKVKIVSSVRGLSKLM